MRSAVISHQQLSPDVPRGPQPDRPADDPVRRSACAVRAGDPIRLRRTVAQEIRDAWEAGAGIGEWLWEHLGGTACDEIGPLADELAVLGENRETAP